MNYISPPVFFPPSFLLLPLTTPRASFKSVVSRGTVASHGTSYHSAYSRFLGRSVSDGGPSEAPASLEGVDNLSFFSFEGEEGVAGGEAQRRLSSISSAPPAALKAEERTAPGVRVYLGYLLVLVVAALHTATSSTTRLLPITASPWLLLLTRSLLQLLLSLPLLLHARSSPLGPPGFRWRLYLVGALSAALVLALHLALTHLPSPEAATLLTLVPLATTLLALPMAGERIGVLRLLTLGLLLAGALLQARPALLFPQFPAANSTLSQYNILALPLTFPSPAAPDPLGVAAGVAVPLVSALLVVLVRQVRAAVPTALLLHWSALGLTLLSMVGIITQEELPVPDLLALLEVEEWLVVGLVGLLGTLATLLLVLVLGWVSVGRAVLVAASSLLMSYAADLAVAGGSPSWPGLLGAAALLLALLVAGVEAMLVHPRRWRWL